MNDCAHSSLRRSSASLAIIAASLLLSAQAPLLQPLDATTPITYFIAEGNSGTGFRPADRQLAQWAFDAWQRSAAGGFVLKPSIESDARIRLYWGEATGGQYGEMRPLMVGSQMGAAVYIRPDINALGPDIARQAGSDALLRETIVYLTCLHELGHAFGLGHTQAFSDIMYFFGYGGDVVEYFGRYRAQLNTRNDIAKTAGLSGADVNTLRSLYVKR